MSYKRSKIRRSVTRKPIYASRFQDMEAKNEDLNTNDVEKLFENRKYYRDNAFPYGNANLSKVRDYWVRSGHLYGRVNTREEPIYLNEYYLRQFRGIQRTVFCLAPVVDAFEDMVAYMKEQKMMRGNIIGPRSPYKKIEPILGWESANKLYSDYLQDYASTWVQDFLTPRRERKITNFASFLELFIESMTAVGPNVPLSFSSFLRSKYCDPRVNGLTIDVHVVNYGNDNVKQGLIDDASFQYWVETVERFGFIMDKNAPWRITANITYNTKMGQYFSKHGIPFWDPGTENPDPHNLEDVFETFYLNTYDVEMPILSHYLAELYNNYVYSRPTISVPTKKTCIDYRRSSFQKIIKTETVKREPLNCFWNRKLDPNSDYLKKYGELFWLRFYYYLRMLEERETINEDVLNSQFRKNISPYYRVHGLNQTVKAINQQITKAAPRAGKGSADFRRLRFI